MSIELFQTIKTFKLFMEKSFLFLNSHLANEKQNEILKRVNLFFQEEEGQNLWQHTLQKESFLLIPTSGTTSFDLKLVLLSKQALLNSAQRVGDFFSFKEGQSWLLNLPLFHVGGLSILARAHLFKQQVVTLEKWDVALFIETLYRHKINLVSLVPTQIHDLVKQQIKAAPSLQVVFVGGGSLSENLFQEAQNLGWPLIKTFGMTETSSMVAVSNNPQNTFSLLPGCKVKINSEKKLLIRCNSLFSGYLLEQHSSDKAFTFQAPQREQDYWCSEDFALWAHDQLTLLGREKDMIKIKGELVNLHHLRNYFMSLNNDTNGWYLHSTIVVTPDERNENELNLVVAKNSSSYNSKPLTSETELKQAIREKLSQFNKNVLPFEKIKHYLIIDSLPQTELGKVKYAELNAKKFLELLNEKRSPFLE